MVPSPRTQFQCIEISLAHRPAPNPSSGPWSQKLEHHQPKAYTYYSYNGFFCAIVLASIAGVNCAWPLQSYTYLSYCSCDLHLAMKWQTPAAAPCIITGDGQLGHQPQVLAQKGHKDSSYHHCPPGHCCHCSYYASGCCLYFKAQVCCQEKRLPPSKDNFVMS